MNIGAWIGLALAIAPAVQREKLNVPYVQAKQLFTKVVSIQTQTKGEYESTADFESRKQSAMDSCFNGGRVFVMADTTPRYDADQGKLTLLTGLNLPSEGDTQAYPPSLVVALSWEDKGTYVGQNGFGAEAAISQSYFHVFKLLCNNDKASMHGLYDGEAGALRVQIPMTPGDASERSPSMRLLLECAVKKPVQFEFRKVSSKTPTFETPYEATTLEYSIKVELKKVIAFDVSTREVFFVKRTVTTTP